MTVYIMGILFTKYPYNFTFFQLECGSKKFKSDIGNKPCTRCGKNSVSRKKYCACEVGHSRAVGEKENSSSDCYGRINKHLL